MKPLAAVVLAVTALAPLAAPTHADEHEVNARLFDIIVADSGVAQWDQVERLQWTFRVELPNGRTVARSWTWHPKTGEVTRTLNGESITYDRDDLADAAPDVIAADRQFINDSFWLIPLWHISQGDPAIEFSTTTQAPITPEPESLPGSARARYGSEGGYTPGDSYELFFGHSDAAGAVVVRQWLFRRGDQGAGRPASFEQYVRLGPLLIATEHRGPEGSGFRLWFEDLEIDLADGQTLGPVPAE